MLVSVPGSSSCTKYLVPPGVIMVEQILSLLCLSILNQVWTLSVAVRAYNKQEQLSIFACRVLAYINQPPPVPVYLSFSFSSWYLVPVPGTTYQVPGTSQKLLKTTMVLPRFWTKIRKMFSRPHLKPFE